MPGSESVKGPRTGGCQCGAVRYEVLGPRLKFYVCHCRECRKQSASAFGMSVFVAREALHLLQGAPKFWARATDSGHILEAAFCPDCGTRLWHQRRGSTDVVSIKAGSLDEPVDLREAVHIWTSRMLPGVLLPSDAVCFPLEPD